MRKLLLLFLVFAMLAVGACSGGAKTVATVNGDQITLADVQALAPSDGSIDTTTFDGNLQNLIIEKVLLQAAEQKWGLTLDQATIDDRYNQILSGLGADDAAIERPGARPSHGRGREQRDRRDRPGDAANCPENHDHQRDSGSDEDVIVECDH